MSSNSIVPLQWDYEINDIKVQMFKLKHDGIGEKDTFDAEKSDGTIIEVLFNTILSFKTMPSQMELTGSLMFPYFDKCLADNALEEWHSVMPHSDNQTTKTFDYSIEEWLTSLLPDNAFVSQKEWITNMMQKSYTMKVKDLEIA